MRQKVTIIKPSSNWKVINFSEIWQFRELITTLVKRDLVLRYKQMLIGASWAIVQPFTTMIVFSFFFGKLAKMPSDGVPYPVFSYSGLLLWTYFSGAISTASSSIVASRGLITKVFFPRIIIPLSSTINGLIDYLVSFCIVIGLMTYYKIDISFSLLLLIPVVLTTWILASAIGFWLSAINVKYRDVRYAIPFFIQLLLYISPVIYPASVAGRFKLILALNPLTGLIESHRAIILQTPIPWQSLSLSIIITLIIFFTGGIYFHKVERSFADII